MQKVAGCLGAVPRLSKLLLPQQLAPQSCCWLSNRGLESISIYAHQ